MLFSQEGNFGMIECEIDLASLYHDSKERARFEARWPLFLASDPENFQVYQRDGNKLRYRTESFVSSLTDDRPPLLLLLGNPASHSAASGMCFAFEGNKGAEHRFWKALRETGILRFFSDTSEPIHKLGWAQANEVRKRELLNLQYCSPFRVGIAVYLSMPSPASDEWSGVAGLCKLFGRKALKRLLLEEDKRISRLIQEFIPSVGCIMTFQKDAFNRLRSDESPAYSLNLAKQGALVGEYKRNRRIVLAGSPPTRCLHTATCRNALIVYKDVFATHS